MVWQMACSPGAQVAAQVDWRLPPPPNPLAQQMSPEGQLDDPLHAKGAPPASAQVPMAVHDVAERQAEVIQQREVNHADSFGEIALSW